MLSRSRSAISTHVSRLDSPWLAALVVAVLNLAVLLTQLRAHSRDPSYFISIGDRYVAQPGELPPNLHVLTDSSGYDGQFYYQLALNPFWPQQVNAGLNLSNSPYRHQRIVYPLLTWLLALGNRDLVPAMLVAVNYLALCAGAWLGGHYAQQHGRHALWGSLFGLYPGYLFTLTRDLTEILTALFLLAGVMSLHAPRASSRALLWLTLAVFTRETAIVALTALGLARVIRGERAWYARLAVPFAAYGLWQVALWARWGRLPMLAGGHNLGLPGIGLVTLIGALETENPAHLVWAAELFYLALSAVLAVVAVRTLRGFWPHTLMWLSYGALAVLLTRLVWIEDLAFMRALTEFWLLSLVLIVAAARLSLLVPLALSTLPTWLLVYVTRLDW